MTTVESLQSVPLWLTLAGFGSLWLGAQIVWVAPLPRALRKGPQPTAPKGSPKAFGLFWIDQYGWIGIALCAFGFSCVVAGWLVSP